MTVCTPAEVGQTMSIGEFITAGEDALEITGVRLVRAEGIELQETFLLPERKDGVGTAQYPPVGVPGWEERVPAAGAHLEPGEGASLVLAVTRTGTAFGTAHAVEVDYSTDGKTASRTNTMSIRLASTCS